MGGGLVTHGSTWAGGHGAALVLLVVRLVSTAAAGTVGGKFVAKSWEFQGYEAGGVQPYLECRN